MKILGLIPARGGSKGLPGKNLRPLAGKSLVRRAFESARAAGSLDRIILSTDDAEIAEEGRRAGLEVPFLRPAELAGDSTPMIDAAVHALEELAKESYRPDALMLLQPTSPLRRPEHINEALRLLDGNDSVCSVVPVPGDLSPHYLMKVTGEGYLDFFMPDGARYTRRQDVPKAWRREGTIFLVRREVALGERSFYGKRCVPLFIEPSESLNIDTAGEWEEAERRLSPPAAP